MRSKPTSWQRIGDADTKQAVQDVVDAMPTNMQAGFRAYRTSALTLGGTVNQTITMDYEEFDFENEYDPTTGLFIPKHTGVYFISAGVALNTNQADGSLLRLMLFKNGSRVRYFHFDDTGGAVAPQMNGSDVILVNAGEYYQVAVTVVTSSTAIFTGTDATWFSAVLLRELGG